jgi:Na+-driven multidrug efflux pump
VELRLFLRITAVTTAIIGATLILFPSFIANLFLPNTDHMADIFIQFVGSSLIGYTYLNWFTARHDKFEQVHAALIGNFSTLLIAFIISLIGVISGGLKEMGWLIVALHFTFGTGFGFFLKKY